MQNNKEGINLADMTSSDSSKSAWKNGYNKFKQPL